MKLKIFVYLPILLLLFLSMACSDNLVSPESSIEKRINAKKPLEYVQVIIDDVQYAYLSKDNSDERRRIEKAYTEDNYLIVVTPYKKYNFNLSTAKSIEIVKHGILLIY